MLRIHDQQHTRAAWSGLSGAGCQQQQVQCLDACDFSGSTATLHIAGILVPSNLGFVVGLLQIHDLHTAHLHNCAATNVAGLAGCARWSCPLLRQHGGR